MNHPYLYADQAPWTEEYVERMDAINKGRGYPDSFEDEEEFMDALYGVV